MKEELLGLIFLCVIFYIRPECQTCGRGVMQLLDNRYGEFAN